MERVAIVARLKEGAEARTGDEQRTSEAPVPVSQQCASHAPCPAVIARGTTAANAFEGVS